ncbi:MAG: gamma-glutamylcyclotransferase family protein [Pseudomonadota bacterium]
MAAEPEHLFIYGTLAPGRPNHHVMGDIEGDWVEASMRGRLVEDGWGAELGYPAIVPSDDGPEVSGFVFSSSKLVEHWARLDAFEGDAYERVSIKATTAAGDVVQAFVYALKAR